jgi:mannose-6-phosphate isomerase-like protein (cupin superfamily)
MQNEILLSIKKELENLNILLTEDDVFNFLKNEKRWPFKYICGQPSVEIIDNFGCKQSFFIKKNGYLNFEEWKKTYDLGFTTIISNILDLNEELRYIDNFLKMKTGKEVNGNFYFSIPGQLPSFSMHSHSYEVFVKQIYGETDWIIGSQKFTLKPQQTTFIPKGENHQVISKFNKKLSLTINLL